MSRVLTIIVAFIMSGCLGGVTAGDQTDSPIRAAIPGDGYFFYETRELFGLTNQVYMGFFGGTRFEILELGFNEGDSVINELRRISRKIYQIEQAPMTLEFHLRESRDTVASEKLDLQTLCPWRLNPIKDYVPITMTIRNSTDTSFDVLVSQKTGWVKKYRIELDPDLMGCLSGD